MILTYVKQLFYFSITFNLLWESRIKQGQMVIRETDLILGNGFNIVEELEN